MTGRVLDIPIPQRKVGCQQMLSRAELKHHGNLRKRRLLDKVIAQATTVFKWPRRYVVVIGGCIYVFKDETSLKPTYATSLYGFTSVEHCDLEVSKEILFPFKLVCALEDRNQNYYFSAPSEKDLALWLKCIGEEMVFANGGLTVNRGGIPPVMKVQPLSSGATSPVSPTVRSLPVLPTTTKTSATSKEQRNVIWFSAPPPDDAVYISDVSSDDSDDEIYQVCGNKDIETKDKKQDVTRSTSKPIANAKSPVSKKTPVKEENDSVYVGGDSYKADTNWNSNETQKSIRIEPSLANAYWMKGADEAEEVMKRIAYEGAYMIRESNEKGYQTLMVYTEKLVRKYKVLMTDDKFCLESSGSKFDSVFHLICHYKTNKLPQRNTKLSRPYSSILTE